MTTITYAEFQANMHFYLERVFRERAIIKVKDGQRSFVLLGESLPTPNSDNIARMGELKIQHTDHMKKQSCFRRPSRPAYYFR